MRLSLLILLLCLGLTYSVAQAEEQKEAKGMSKLELGLRIAAIVVLVMLSGLFSGLTLGLMGLDKIGLEIVIGAGQNKGATPEEIKQAAAAKRIEPIRANGNLLLTTLLLGNVAVNSLMSILAADLTSGTVAFLGSTAVIVVFGEIIPQAFCSRYPLLIGARAIPIVRVIMAALYILAKPISVVLDRVLGDEIGTIYSKGELKKMLEIHVGRDAIDEDEGNIMSGAISYKEKKVDAIMTPLELIYMLPVSAKLSYTKVREIFESGYSRIPVYKDEASNIVGLLFVKDLIFVDPEDEIPVLNFVQIFGRGVHKIWPDTTLDSCLKLFKVGRGHLALVFDVNNSGPNDPHYELQGLVTLEDIIEEIIQDEIVDETDVFIEVEKSNPVDRSAFDTRRLQLLDSRITEEKLGKEETKAVAAHLYNNHKIFRQLDNSGRELTETDLRHLVAECTVEAYDPSSEKQTLYQREIMNEHCAVLLCGSAMISAGRDGFESQVGPWTVLAAEVLVAPIGQYIPDFTATVTGKDKVRCLIIPREKFQKYLNPPAQSSVIRNSVFPSDLSELSTSDDHPYQKLGTPKQASSVSINIPERD